MLNAESGLRKLLLVGATIAVPLALVALYFALFDQPPPQAPGARAPMGQGPAAQPALPPNHPPIAGQGTEPAGAPPPAHPQVGPGARPVRVPDSVKGKWSAVRLRIEGKSGGRAPDVVTVKLGGDFQIPGSPLTVRVGDFLPALQVGGAEITSASNDPVNPAAFVTVLDGGKEIFRGWLFSKFPEMQPFEHPTYRITLVEGVPRG
jgi:hypothetical protein